MGRSSIKSSKKLISDNNLSQLSVSSCKYGNKALIGGTKNYEKFPVKLSQQVIAEINKTRKLPEGYLLQYTPKTISYEYYEGTYMKNTIVPPTYNVIKTTKSPEDFENVTVTDMLPVGFKFMNIEHGTYITRLAESKETLTKKVSKKDFLTSAKNLLSFIFK